MAVDTFADGYQTTLTSSVTAGGTTVHPTITSGAPAANPTVVPATQFRLVIQSAGFPGVGTREVVTVTDNRTSTWTCTATVNAYSAGDTIAHVVSSAALGSFSQKGAESYDFERDFAAPTNGTSDATTALQNAINTMFAAGGGKLRCNTRTYAITNVTFPSNALTNPTVTITIEGALAPQTVPFCPGTGGNTFNVPALTGGTIFKSTATSGDAFGGLSAVSNVMMVFRNVIVRCPANPQCNGIHGGWLENMITENVAADTGGSTGSGAGSVTQPTNAGTTGIIYPGVGNGGTSQAWNTSAQGFGVGINHSEHFLCDNLTVFKNLVGIRVVDGYHSARYGRVSLYWNAVGWQTRLNADSGNNTPSLTTPVTRIEASQIDTEETDETSAWYKTTAHIDDPMDRARGRFCYHRVVPAVGIKPFLLRNGGNRLDLLPVGSTPKALLDIVSSGIANSATTAPTSDTGAPPQALRGTWGVNGFKLYLGTISGTAAGDLCVWDVGTNQVVVATKVTPTSATAANNGIVLMAVDANNWVAVIIGPSTISIQKTVSGTYTTLATTGLSIVTGQEFDLKVLLIGKRIMVYVDGNQVTSYTLSGAEWTLYSPSTSHGVWAYTSGFENGTGRWKGLRIETAGPIAA